MAITTKEIKELREKTGVPIVECKKALEESKGNFDEAVEILKKKTEVVVLKKADRKAVEGLIGSYVHTNGKIGVLVEVNCETDFVARNSEFKELVKDIAMHIAALNPKYLSPTDVDAEELEKEKEICRAQFTEKGKPEEIMDKIIKGKISKYCEEISLLKQPFVKNPDITVEELINEKIAKLGEKIGVKRFIRYEL